MAYRRRQQVVQLSRPPISVGEEEPVRNPRRSVPLSRDEVDDDVVEGSKDVPVSLHSSDSSSSPSPPSSSSLAAKAMRASSAHRDSSHSSAYASQPASRFSNPASSHSYTSSFPPSQDSTPFEYTSMKNLNESKHGFWGVLARKAKSIIDDDDGGQPSATFARTRDQVPSSAGREKFSNRGHSDERNQKVEGSTLQRGLGAIASSFNYLGGTIGNAFEESITIVENKTADIIQETRKHIRKKPSGAVEQNHAINRGNAMHQHLESGQELQLKASRDVAMAMAAKAKLLLRELKTVKADLAFAKERCAQLEDENKILRENRERGDSLDDDDLIRLQLETLLAEKARLAHENSVYARENRFLREIVEYHQLTMQDVVYFDEGTEEVTEVYPIKVTSASNLNSISAEVDQSLAFTQPPQAGLDTSSQMTRIIPTRPVQPSELRGISRTSS